MRCCDKPYCREHCTSDLVLQAEDPKVVQELMACTKALRPLHLDRRFHHNKRMRGAARRVLSQQWYVRADDWVAGTAAPTQATPAFFDLPVRGVPFPVLLLIILIMHMLPLRSACISASLRLPLRFEILLAGVLVWHHPERVVLFEGPFKFASTTPSAVLEHSSWLVQ